MHITMKFKKNRGKIGIPKKKSYEIPIKWGKKLEFQKKILMKFQKNGEKLEFVGNVHLGCTFSSLIQWKTSTAFVFEFRYVIIDQLYDKFSITKPIKFINITNK